VRYAALSIGINLRSKTNAGKVFSYVYLRLTISPSSPNPFSHRGEKGNRTKDAPLSRAKKAPASSVIPPLAPLSPAWERGWGRGVELKLTLMSALLTLHIEIEVTK